jgi:hypothetical protein
MPLGQTAPAGESADWPSRIRPELEKALGYSFSGLPKVVAASDADMRRAVEADLAAHLRWKFPHLKEDALATAMDDGRAVLASATVARLLEGTNIIFVRAENLAAIARRDPSLKDAAGPDFLKLAVAHEMVRYALDSRHDLPRRREQCRDAEQWFALQAIVEGRAQQVTQRLAQGWQLDRTFPLLAESLLHVPDRSADPALRTFSQSAVVQQQWACTHGRKFVDRLEGLGIGDVEKCVFVHPPRGVACIDSPDLYVQTLRGQRRDLADVLKRLEPSLPAPAWTCTQQPWTPDMVRQAAELVGQKGERVLTTWEEGRILMFTKQNDPARQVALSLARFGAPAGARSYFGFALELHRKRDELSRNAALPLRLIDSRSRTVSFPEVDEAVLIERTMQWPGGNTMPQATLLARKEQSFVEITWQGMPADMDWAGKALAECLRSAEKSTQAKPQADAETQVLPDDNTFRAVLLKHIPVGTPFGKAEESLEKHGFRHASPTVFALSPPPLCGESFFKTDSEGSVLRNVHVCVSQNEGKVTDITVSISYASPPAPGTYWPDLPE